MNKKVLIAITVLSLLSGCAKEHIKLEPIVIAKHWPRILAILSPEIIAKAITEDTANSKLYMAGIIKNSNESKDQGCIMVMDNEQGDFHLLRIASVTDTLYHPRDIKYNKFTNSLFVCNEEKTVGSNTNPKYSILEYNITNSDIFFVKKFDIPSNTDSNSKQDNCNQLAIINNGQVVTSNSNIKTNEKLSSVMLYYIDSHSTSSYFKVLASYKEIYHSEADLEQGLKAISYMPGHGILLSLNNKTATTEAPATYLIALAKDLPTYSPTSAYKINIRGLKDNNYVSYMHISGAKLLSMNYSNNKQDETSNNDANTCSINMSEIIESRDAPGGFTLIYKNIYRSPTKAKTICSSFYYHEYPNLFYPITYNVNEMLEGGNIKYIGLTV